MTTPPLLQRLLDLLGWTSRPLTPHPQQEPDIEILRKSPLFDAQYYLDQHPDVRVAGADPATHYFRAGWKELRDPSKTFSTKAYLDAYPDVADAAINPLWHFLRFGQQEGRMAAPPAGHHDLSVQVNEILASGRFDARYYRTMYPDVRQGVDNPVWHYCAKGWKEGKNPSDRFDTRFYRDQYPDIRLSGINPLWHYVRSGHTEARKPLPAQGSKAVSHPFDNTWHSDIRIIAFFAPPNGHHRRLTTHTPTPVHHPTPHPDPDGPTPSEADILESEAKLAQAHGIHAWCFSIDASTPVDVGHPLNTFLAHPSIGLKCMIEIDPHPADLHPDTARLLANAFSDERYLHLADRPALLVGLRRKTDATDTDSTVRIDPWPVDAPHRPFLIARIEEPSASLPLLSPTVEWDAALTAPFDKTLAQTLGYRPDEGNGMEDIPYACVASMALESIQDPTPQAIPQFRTVSAGLDAPIGSADLPFRYTRWNIHDYRRWLDGAITEVRTQHPEWRRLIFIDAWNDGKRGAALHPDSRYGKDALHETTQALYGVKEGLAMPKVSVVVPNTYPEASLRQRLESICAQTYRNFEVLLPDAGADGGSGGLFAECMARNRHNTRTYACRGNPHSPFSVWASGIEQATGDLVWIAGSEGQCVPDFLEKMIRCFDDESVLLACARSIAVGAGDGIRMDTAEAPMDEAMPLERWNASFVNTAHREVLDTLGWQNPIPDPSAVLFKRPVDMTLLRDTEWLSMRRHGDWVFYLHLIRGGRLAYVAETTSFYRKRPEDVNTLPDGSVPLRDLCLVAATVQRLYDTPLALLDAWKARLQEHHAQSRAPGESRSADGFDATSLWEARMARTPNIALSNNGFHPGGAEILPIRMANEYKRLGHSVALISVRKLARDEAVRSLLRPDVPLLETDEVGAFRQLLKDLGIEVLNSHNWPTQHYPSLLNDVFHGLKAHVATLHGMIEHGNSNSVSAQTLRLADANVTTWVATADKNLDTFRDLGLFPDDSPRFVKLPNGLPPVTVHPVLRAAMGIPDDAFVLCCVSRAIPEKGWAECIEAVSKARLLSSIDIRLILVGDGPEYDRYCGTGVPAFVHLEGLNLDSVGFYATADAGIMLTRFKSESFPLTIIDCLFAGKPFIATSVGEIRTMLTLESGPAGEVVKLVDWAVPVDEVATVIADFAQRGARYRSAIERVPEAAHRFRIEHVIGQYLGIFQRDIRATRHGGIPTHPPDAPTG